MTTSALLARPLPDYTKGEETANSISHLAGAAFGVFALNALLANSYDTLSVISSLVYGLSIIVLYLVSGVYHGLSPKMLMAKQVLRNVDHCAIYVLIAGSYTPFLLNIMYRNTPKTALAIFAGIWAVAMFGMIFTAIDPDKYAKQSMFYYMALGWFALLLIKTIINGVGITGTLLLASGGVSYTVGALFYGLGKRRYMHFVFHLFVILGTLLQYICIFKYII